jgi:hypothetical protein
MTTQNRTIQAEVDKRLAKLDEHLKMTFKGTKLETNGLAVFAFNQMLESASSSPNHAITAHVLLAWLRRHLAFQNWAFNTYLHSSLKSCAHCVAAVLYERSGNEIRAWQEMCDATSEAAVAVSIFSTISERSHRASTVSSKAGSARGQKNNALKEYVLKTWREGGFKKRGTAAAAIAKRFSHPRDNPELKLTDFGDADISLENPAKRFNEWIKEEEEKNPVSK